MNKYILSLLATCCITLHSLAQSTDSLRLSGPSLTLESHVLVKASEGLFYLARQEYVMRDSSGLDYGRDGANYYGAAYAVGVCIGNGKIVFPSAALAKPWLSDNAYKSAPQHLKPVSAQLTCTDIKTKQRLPEAQPAINDNFTAVLPGPEAAPSVLMSRQAPKTGKLVVFYIDRTASPDSLSRIQKGVYPVTAAWDADGTTDVKNQSLNIARYAILGGAFFEEIITLGQVTYTLAGIYTQTGTKWEIKDITNLVTAPVNLTPITNTPKPNEPEQPDKHKKKKHSYMSVQKP